jgi:hypothetical protein
MTTDRSSKKGVGHQWWGDAYCLYLVFNQNGANFKVTPTDVSNAQ